jgi:hypothetical protein
MKNIKGIEAGEQNWGRIQMNFRRMSLLQVCS